MNILICYDISKNKLRNKVIEILKDYGLQRVQYSVFLGELENIKIQSVMNEIKKIINETEGDIKLFYINKIKDKNLIKDKSSVYWY